MLAASPSLSKVQRWMRWSVTGRGKEPARCIQVIGQTPELSRQKRLSIYGEGYFLRLMECLGANYVCLKNAVGEHAFNHLARAYITRHPSTYKYIDNVGHRLNEFLKKHPLTRQFRFLPDLATLEWAYHESFYGDDQKPLNKRAFAAWSQQDWLSARIHLNPSVRLLALQWPVEALWRADGKWNERRLRNISRRKSNLVVFKRTDGLVRVAALEKSPFELLKAFQSGLSLNAALCPLSRNRSLPPTAPGRWLADWVNVGLISDVRI